MQSTSQLQPQLSFGAQNQTMVDLGLSQILKVLQVQHQQSPIEHQVSTNIVIDKVPLIFPEYSKLHYMLL